MEKLVIKNIGGSPSEEPIIVADCLVAIDGKIDDCVRENPDCEAATTVVDAKSGYPWP